MSVVAAGSGTDFGLVCDTCGRRVLRLGATLHNWEQAWAFMTQHGWTGSALAVGAHRCQACPPAATAADPSIDRPVRWPTGPGST